jgi:hypothetical protein
MSRTTFSAPVFAVLFSLVTTQALALDSTAFADRFTQAYTAQSGGGTLTYTETEVKDDTVILKGLSFAVDPQRVQPIPDVTFVGVREENGGWRAGLMTLPDVYSKAGMYDFVLTNLMVEELVIPPATAQGYASFIQYDRLALAELALKKDGEPFIGAIDFVVLATHDDAKEAMEFKGLAKMFYVNAGAQATGAEAETIKALGLDYLDGPLVINGSWSATDGKLALSEYSYEPANKGKVSLSMAVDGYTPEFIKAFGDGSAWPAAEPALRINEDTL